jgi:putative ABC transport system ATP-binding protein
VSVYMLQLNGITKFFNKGTQDEKCALDHFSLNVGEGDFVTIIGSNGAGKSTLLNIVAGTCGHMSKEYFLCCPSTH